MTCVLRNAVIGGLIVGALALITWQQTHLQRLTAENERLFEQAAQLKTLQHENERLRKVEIDRTELERLRTLQSEVAKLRAQVAAAASAASHIEASARTGATGLAQPAADVEATNQLSGNVGQMMKGLMEQQLMGQLSRMKTRLNLTPEQEQAIREILTRQIEQSAAISQKMLSGKMTKQGMAESANAVGDPEEQIRALLSPEQQAAYKDFKTEDNAANARLVANAEMLQMQNVLGLSQEQQDQVFSALYEYTQKQMAGSSTDPAMRAGDPIAFMERQLTEKTKALEKLLTPAQLQSYRQMQETQLKLMKSMIPPGP